QREQLSHNLHDGAVQSIYAIQLGLTGIEKEVQSVSPGTANRLAAARTGLDVVIGELRDFITQMQDEELSLPLTSLGGVLQSLVQRLQSATATSIALECDARASSLLSPNQTLELAAIAREALSNSLRHAGATQITIILKQAGEGVVLEVADNGKGFD